MDVIDRGAWSAVGIRKKAGSRSTAGATGVSEANASRGSDDESNSCEPIIRKPFLYPHSPDRPKLTFKQAPRLCAHQCPVRATVRPRLTDLPDVTRGATMRPTSAERIPLRLRGPRPGLPGESGEVGGFDYHLRVSVQFTSGASGTRRFSATGGISNVIALDS